MVQRVERKYGKKRKPPSLSPPALVLLSSRTKEDMGRGFLDKERGSVSGEKKRKEGKFPRRRRKEYMLQSCSPDQVG